ncbi:hypothetical protein N7457_005793 [Penicillium paradoxum]|uniref:uncharacterized protein n=1 Tax=Penicillium paradoxum TaxID=176176 RepID=UPI002547600A|nr:uncharacterized protein N7457_005793 [Penicillium paradoxum]KAJ5780633.1 hypothetical protein N7457_005793 [Penicillium paradoxum]
MAELACTAIGVLSFALEVCQGIVSYKQAWADCDDDMQNARNKAEVLCMMLKTLRETIEELQQTNPRIAADLEQKALSMRTSIEKLVKIVDRFKPAPFEAFPAKVRAQVRKGLYPFYKDAVKDAHVQLDQIQTILQTSLLIYNWQDTRAARVMQISIYEEMRSMHSTLKNTISSTGMPPPSLLQVVCDRQREEVPIMLMQKRSSRDEYGLYQNLE